jgi:dienelactone hydrolase
VRAVAAVVLFAIGVAMLPGAHEAAAAATSAAGTCADGPVAGTPVPDADPAVTRVDFTLAHRVAGRCRVLVTQVRSPTGTGGKLPVILAIHGADGDPSRLAPLLDVWAKAGHVVAAPTFLKTRKDARGKALASEVAQQAADARFVLDELLDRAPALRIDPSEVGVAGMSLGGMTVYGLISHTCCQDGRIQAAIVMAGVHDNFPSGRYVHQSVPVLLIQGDADIGYHHSRDAYPQLAPPKFFITLHGERHSPPFEVPRGAVAGVVDVTTTLFWKRYLGDDIAAARALVRVVAATKGKATLQRDLSAK